jgi:hypothetical protein
MSGQFKVGEVLVGQNCRRLPQYNGMDCVVRAGLARMQTQHRFTGEIIEGYFYMVVWSDGWESPARPDQLRRKQPPAGEQSVLDMFKLPAPSKEIA